MGVPVGVIEGVSVGSGVTVEAGVLDGVPAAWGVEEKVVVGVRLWVEVGVRVARTVKVAVTVGVGGPVGVKGAGAGGVKVWVGLLKANGLEGTLVLLLQAGGTSNARAASGNKAVKIFFMSGSPYRPMRTPATTGTSLPVASGEKMKLYFPSTKTKVRRPSSAS